MEYIILLFISVLPVVLIGTYIYFKDRNRESLTLLMKLFIGGILSTFLTLIISILVSAVFPFFNVDHSALNAIDLLLYAFIYVALIEEFSKWLFLYAISYNDAAFDEIYDMIIYAAFVALGFACFENILYVFESGIVTGITRALSAVPGHASDGVLMGYFLGLAKQASLNGNINLKKKYVALSLIVPVVMHGIYDYLLMLSSGLAFLVFIIFIITFYIFVFKKIKQVSNVKGKMFYKNQYCPICGNKVSDIYCSTCGNLNE